MTCDPNYTHISFIVDRSGSMAGKESDTIGGFNSLIVDQKKIPGKCTISFHQFDHEYITTFDTVTLSAVRELTQHDYTPRGMTALYDAIGKTINLLGESLRKLPESSRPSKVLIIIITDGAENASKEFDKNQIVSMIEHQKNKYQWEFVFLGADLNSVADAQSLSINPANTFNYSNTKKGVSSAYSGISMLACSFRSSPTQSLNVTPEMRKIVEDSK